MQRTCRQCASPFEITPSDLAFYEKVSPVFAGKKELIPPPTLCPDCRQQRRLAWRNERTLRKDHCDLCGASIISMYAPDAPHPVYCYECWWGERWDPLTYGQEVDFTGPFFEQLAELRKKVPRLYLFNLHSENCIYTSHSANNKNCYMGVALGKCEDCYYGHWVLESKDVVNAMYCEYCERCYECSYCLHCFGTSYSQSCQMANGANSRLPACLHSPITNRLHRNTFLSPRKRFSGESVSGGNRRRGNICRKPSRFPRISGMFPNRSCRKRLHVRSPPVPNGHVRAGVGRILRSFHRNCASTVRCSFQFHASAMIAGIVIASHFAIPANSGRDPA